MSVKALAVVVRPRDGALLVREGQDGTGQGYARPIGGSVEPEELAEAAIRREVREELGCELIVEGLLAVVVNQFVLDGQERQELDVAFSGRLEHSALYGRERLPVLDVPGLEAVWWTPQTHRSRLVPPALGGLLLDRPPG